jgi:hypothetical protein
MQDVARLFEKHRLHTVKVSQLVNKMCSQQACGKLVNKS